MIVADTSRLNTVPTRRVGGLESRVRVVCWLIAALVVSALGMALLVESAAAQDPQTGLAEAQVTASAAQSEIATAEAGVATAKAEWAPVAEHAAAASDRAEEALARVDRLEEKMVDRRVDAAAEVTATEARYQEAVDEHDESVANAYGIAIGAALLAALVFGWEWFRRLPIVERLADQNFGRAGGILSILIRCFC